MKLTPINMDYSLLQFDALKFFLRVLRGLHGPGPGPRPVPGSACGSGRRMRVNFSENHRKFQKSRSTRTLGNWTRYQSSISFEGLLATGRALVWELIILLFQIFTFSLGKKSLFIPNNFTNHKNYILNLFLQDRKINKLYQENMIWFSFSHVKHYNR